jgi:hypothetical protein
VSRIPDEVPETFDHEDTNALVRRLADFGWFTGSQLVTPEDFSIHFSEKGSSRMRELVGLLKIIAPHFFGLPPRPLDPTLFADFILGVVRIAPELVASGISERESNALIALIGGYAMKNPPTTSPPRF